MYRGLPRKFGATGGDGMIHFDDGARARLSMELGRGVMISADGCAALQGAGSEGGQPVDRGETG